MGQQQLLLLVLGMVIVGIAVVAGIQAFSEGQQKATRDAAISDAMRVISDAQAWKLKPAAFGGGANDTAADFDGISFQALGLDPADDAGTNNTNYETQNGCFTLSGSNANATIVINEPDCSTEIATVTLTGTDVDNISWAYATGGSGGSGGAS